MIRWLKFNAVGLMGVAVQLGALTILVKARMHYLAATALAVELAILHNYAWHVKWTWAGRGGSLLRFHVANGLVSIVSNVVLMRWFTGMLGWPVVPANLVAIALTSVVTFFLGDRWVFLAKSAASPGRGFQRRAQRVAGKTGHDWLDDPGKAERDATR